MKRLILICYLLCFLLPSVWAIETDDHFTISDVTVVPGGEQAYFDVSLEGSRAYSAYNLDIHLPEGLSVYMVNNKPAVSMLKNEGMYPSTEDVISGDITYSHVFSCSYGEAGERTLRVACYSNSSESLTANSGTLFRVMIVASAFMKPGTANLQFDGQNLTTSDATKYVPADASLQINVATTSQASISITANNKWSTCILPFDAALPTGLKAYSCSEVEGDALVLVEAASIVAYTPYILYAENGYNGTLSGVVDATKYVETATAGYLHGAVVPQEVSEGYILQNQGDGAKFYQIQETTFAVPSGRCWAVIPGGNNAVVFSLGHFTDIKGVKAHPMSDAIFTIDGKSVKTPKAGQIYIINNKKVVK